jgi:uncharacterized transporter YbjL
MLNFSAAELIIPLVTGVVVGYLLRGTKHVSFGRVTLAAILVLIFSLGFGIGSNNELLGSLVKVGLNAVVIASLAIVFSVVFVKAVRKLVRLS